MPFVFTREAPKLWRKVCAETSTELSLLAGNWKFVLAGLIFQYLHGLAAHGVHYLHRPGATLQDAGLFLLPWTFHPFVFQSKKIYTVLIWCRIFAYLVPRGVMYGCGDLIFSSHMIFTLVFVRTYQKYGTKRYIKQFIWLVAVILSLLILASRKHYTVDVVVAWYTVNLVVLFIDQNLPEMPDRSYASPSQQLLPVSSRDKDSKNREDKFLNGNSTNITTLSLDSV